jgi:2-C-methyl-D-erythritol 4-phosphate cytidylyltransferase
VVAGGSGSRFGRLKQFLPLAGRSVVAWSVDAARGVADGVVLVVPDLDDPTGSSEASAASAAGADRVVTGGASRAASVRAGLAAVPADAEVVVVHDAARPLASRSLFAAVVDALDGTGADGVVPVLAVSDTLKRVSEGRVQATVDRDGLVTVQTPQAFRAASLRAAHADEEDATDDAGLLEAMGATVRTVPGEICNLKLTRPEDVAVAEAMIEAASR